MSHSYSYIKSRTFVEPSPKVTTKKFSYLENYLSNLKKKKDKEKQEKIDRERKKEKEMGKEYPEKPIVKETSEKYGTSIPSHVRASQISVQSTTSNTSDTSTISRTSNYNYLHSYGRKSRNPYGSTTSLPAVTITQSLQRTGSLRSTGSLPMRGMPPRQDSVGSSTSSVNTPVSMRRSFFRQAREEVKFGSRSPSMFDLYKYRTLPAKGFSLSRQTLLETPPPTPVSMTPPPMPPVHKMQVSGNGVCMTNIWCDDYIVLLKKLQYCPYVKKILCLYQG